ncbi:uncharacterized protein GIQ15_05593 [Arthroderma uncinatum]|uniref:uncharacterized protein n=1 Tax=Arthroderma uncinatum TaxID=74035 RepID=UPI00144A69EC|nr:uncharacterized protein GIQ15_05593 [Arthroderma uncinatum]KAF3480246.1 hypothetical protein GIQ15_05593 [Arthroderma uncinatum]
MFRHKHQLHADLSDTDSEEEFYHRVHRRPRDNVIIEDRRRPRSTSEVHRRRPGDAAVYIDINNEQGLQGNTRLAPPPAAPVGRARSVSRRRPALADELSDLEDEFIRHERRAIRRLQREEPSRRAEIEAEVRLERIRQREHELDEMRKEEDRVRREEERIRREDRIRREERERIESGKSKQAPERREETELEREFRIAKEEEIRSMRRWRKMQEYKEWQEMERPERRSDRQDREESGLSRRDIEKEIQLERLKKIESDDIARRKIEDALLIERMKALEEEREEKEHERKVRAKVEAEIAQKEKDEMERLQQEMKLKVGAIEEYKKKEAEKELKRREEEEKANKEFTDKVNQLFGAAGFSEDKITAILEGKPIKEKEKEIVQVDRYIHHGRHRDDGDDEEAFVKVHRRYVDARTLDAFNLTWEYDPNDADYMLIYHVLCQEDQDRLFEHTRRIRGQRVITATPHNGPVMVEMKVNDKKKDGMFLVRKKADKRGLFW